MEPILKLDATRSFDGFSRRAWTSSTGQMGYGREMWRETVHVMNYAVPTRSFVDADLLPTKTNIVFARTTYAFPVIANFRRECF